MRILLLSLMIAHLYGQSMEQIPTGARPLGMGGAFVGVADDANALNWNPAGLPGLRRTEFTSSYSNLYELGISHSYLGFVRNFSDRIAFGLDWGNVGFDDKELLFSENKLNLSLGVQLPKGLSIGLTTKYLSRDMQLDGTSYGKSDGIGYDVGALWQITKKIRLGLAMYDLGGTSVTYKDRSEEIVLPEAAKIGFSIKPLENLLLAFDYGDRLHAGAELAIANKLFLRTGLQQENFSGESLSIYSIGTSLKFKSIIFDYGVEINPYFEPTHRFSLVLQFSPAVVSITKSTISHNPILDPYIGITNLSLLLLLD